MSNNIKLENLLRKMVQEVIREEVAKIGKIGLDDWEYANPEDKKIWDKKFSSEKTTPNPPEPANPRAPLPITDPGFNVRDEDRIKMLDSLLVMEFQEGPKKSLPVAVFKEMIRASVLKHLKGQ